MNRKTAIEKLRKDIRGNAAQKHNYRAERHQYKLDHADERTDDTYRDWFITNDQLMRELRASARAEHLALAYLRGRAYKTIEPKCRPGCEAWRYGVAWDVATQLQCALDPVPIEQQATPWRHAGWKAWLARVQSWAKDEAAPDLSELPKPVPVKLVEVAP